MLLSDAVLKLFRSSVDEEKNYENKHFVRKSFKCFSQFPAERIFEREMGGKKVEFKEKHQYWLFLCNFLSSLQIQLGRGEVFSKQFRPLQWPHQLL